MAEVGIWDAVVDSATITALASGDVPSAFPTNLIFYYAAKADTTTAETGGAAATDDGTSYSSAHPLMDYFSTLAGALTPAGALINSARKILAGALTWAGELATQFTGGGGTEYTQAVGGAITPAGALVKSARKVLAGALTPAGVVLKRAGKVVAGEVTPAGPVAWIRDVFISPAGTITPAGTVTKAGRKVLSGGLTPSGVVATIKAALISLGGELAPAGALVKSARKVLAGALTFAGTVVHRISKILSGALTSAGDLIGTFLAGGGTLYTQAVDGTLTSAGVLVSQARKLLGGAITPNGGMVRAISRSLFGSLAPVGAVAKAISKYFGGTLSSLGGLIASLLGLSTPGSVTLSDSLSYGYLLGANYWIVSPTGTPTGAGWIGDPLDIDTVIGTSSPVQPGDTVYLRGTPITEAVIDARGIYTPLAAGEVAGASATNGSAVAGKGVQTYKINGTALAPIVIRNYPGESVRINGAVHVSTGQGSYITFRGLEIAATPTTRSFANRAAVDFPGIYITAAGVTIDRCYIHDLAQVYVMGTGGCTITQNVIGLCGMYLTDEAYTGYSIYTHNASGGAVTIKKNVFLGAYNGYNLGFQSAGANAIRDYDAQQNVMFAGGALWGSASGVDDNNSFTYNKIYNPARTASILYTSVMRSRGYDNSNGEGWTVQNNLMWFKGGDPPLYLRALGIDFSSNTLVGTGGVFAKLTQTIYTEAITMDNNTYYATLTPAGFTHPSSGVGLTLAQWRTASGWDLNSTYTVGLPASNETGVLADDDYDGRGIVYAFNFLGSSSITFDLTTLNITDGARCRYTNALNKAEYVDFTYDADAPTLTISMLAASWSVATPTAHDAPRAWASEPFPDFGVFLVEEIESSPSTGVIGISASDSLIHSVTVSDGV